VIAHTTPRIVEHDKVYPVSAGLPEITFEEEKEKPRSNFNDHGLSREQ